MNTTDVTRLLKLAHNPLTATLINQESKAMLEEDPFKRASLYKAPVYLACTVIDDK